MLGIGAVTEPKKGKAERPQAVGVVELLAPEISPELGRVLGHVPLASCRRDEDDEGGFEQICLVFTNQFPMQGSWKRTHRIPV